MSERKLQKRLTTLGLVSLASIPFTGPLGLVGAGAVFSGKILRYSRNNEARKNYETEKKALKKSNKTSVPSYNFVNESPQTSIARQIPSQAIKLLERDHQRTEYNEGLRIGSQIADNYLESLSPKEYAKIKSIEIYPEQENKLLGRSVGRKYLEVKIRK